MSRDFKRIEVFDGPKYINDFKGNDYGDPIFELKGTNGQEESTIVGFDADMFSKHLLILGGIGMGKTNTFKAIVSDTSKTMSNNDVMLIFDTKGDFYNAFGNPKKDFLISNTPIKSASKKETSPEKKDIWNIFLELDEDKLYETSNEIATMIFAPHVEKSSQAFFPLAAKSIFASVLRAFYRLYFTDKYKNHPFIKSNGLKYEQPSNLLLKKFFNGETFYANVDEELCESNVLASIINLLTLVEEEKGTLGYISAPNGENEAVDGQTLGVLAELRLVIDELFIGNFAKDGDFSMRRAIRERSGKRIFLEYDMIEGTVLSPIYSLLVDLAIKESLDPKGNLNDLNSYFIIDEFKLLPHLKHMDDAVNFGRSLGVKFVIGVQNISQIIENYGESGAMNILSGFLNIFAFKVSDYPTRKYLVELFGGNRKRTTYLSAIHNRGVIESLENGNAVEDWDLLRMKKFECIVRLSSDDNDYTSPFLFKPLLFK